MKTLLRIVLGIVGVLFLLLVTLAFLVLRPAEKVAAPAFSGTTMHFIMSATGKLAGVMFRGLREPEKMFTVTFTPGETDAILASVRQLVNPHLDDTVMIRSIKVCDGKIAVEVDLPLGAFEIPFVGRCKAEMSSGTACVTADSLQAGKLPLPVKVLQQLVDEGISDFFRTTEGKIFRHVISRIEFFPDGSSEVDATAQGFRFLRDQLFMKLPPISY